MNSTHPDKDRTDADILAIARALGLKRLAEEFGDDVVVAARVADKLRSSFTPTDDLTREIWPVMTVRG